jgi:hypothetical protein
MGNTLTGLTNFIYDTADVVSREQTGMIASVYKNTAADQVAKNQDITYDIVPDAVGYDIAPAAAIPALDATTVGTGTMAITSVVGTKFHWTGEDELAIGRNVRDGIQNNKFAQAFRFLSNRMEADLCALQSSASRAYASHATTPIVPFATAGDFTDLSLALKILKDNGAPQSELRAVINTTAGANVLGKQSQSQMAGSSDPLRQGVLLDLFGSQLRESSKIVSTTAVGNNTETYAINGAHVAGATTLTVKTGTGTILAGDAITIGTDTATKYIVKTGVNNGTEIVIQAPGLVKALAGNETIAVVAVCARNMVFARSAIHLLTRLPAMPEGGDSADDVMVVQDPVSGIFFQVALYRAYRSVLIEVAAAWGVKAAKTEHIGLLLGQ